MSTGLIERPPDATAGLAEVDPNELYEVVDESELPGFRLDVAELFGPEGEE